MDVAELYQLTDRVGGLAKRRWRHLLVGVGVVVLVNVALLELLLHGPWGGGGSSSGGSLPSFGSLALGVTIGYLVVVAYMSLPMALATSALTEGDDDDPRSFLVPSVMGALRQWARLAVIASPAWLLSLWAVHSVMSMIEDVLSSALSGDASEPGKPLVLKLVSLLMHHPIDWVIAVAFVGAWCLYAAVDALRIQRGWLPGHPLPLVRDRAFVVGVLAVASAIVLGPLLRKVLGGVVTKLVPTDPTSATETLGVVTVVLLTAVAAAFVSAAALAWVALFEEDASDVPVGAGRDSAGPQAASPGEVGAPAPAEATAPTAVAEAAAGATPEVAPVQGQAHDLPAVVHPGGSAGWWVFVPAGASIGVGAWVGAGAVPRLMVSDAAGSWADATPAADGSHVFASPADGWYYVAACSQDPAPQQLHVRLLLPPGTHLQPAQHQSAA